ncbi:hypothetical protein [Helicobacter sp. T3_23-1059]
MIQFYVIVIYFLLDSRDLDTSLSVTIWCGLLQNPYITSKVAPLVDFISVYYCGI